MKVNIKKASHFSLYKIQEQGKLLSVLENV